MFAAVSPVRSALNMTSGGELLTPLKYECGARLRAPSGPTVDTHAMGRGTMIDVSSR